MRRADAESGRKTGVAITDASDKGLPKPSRNAVTSHSARPRTLGQNKRLWKLTGELAAAAGIDKAAAEEIMRTIVERVSGQRSTKRLTTEQCDAVLKTLRARIRDVEHCSAERELGLVSRREMELIDGLLRLLDADTLAQRTGLIKRILGKPLIETEEDARAVIEALASMVERRYDVRSILHSLTKPDIYFSMTEWERRFVNNLLDREEKIERNRRSKARRRTTKLFRPGATLKLLELARKYLKREGEP